LRWQIEDLDQPNSEVSKQNDFLRSRDAVDRKQCFSKRNVGSLPKTADAISARMPIFTSQKIEKRNITI
jgi:hypothetical protein